MRRYQLPSAEDAPQDNSCPRCGRATGRTHQVRRQWIVDTQRDHVGRIRLHCAECDFTWSLDAQGLSAHSGRTVRVRILNVLLYSMGMSYGGVVRFLAERGVSQGRSSVYRDVEEFAELARRMKARGARTIQTNDEADPKQNAERRVETKDDALLIRIDGGAGCVLDLWLLDAEDLADAERLLIDLCRYFGAE